MGIESIGIPRTLELSYAALLLRQGLPSISIAVVSNQRSTPLRNFLSNTISRPIIIADDPVGLITNHYIAE
jgi:hypothetical protein